MSHVDFDSIAPLVADQRVSGRTVSVVFKCPVTGQTTEARVNVPQRQRTVGNSVSQAAKRQVGYSARRATYSVMRSVFGRGMFGRIAADMAGAVVQSATSQQRQSGSSISRKEQQEAVVQAFSQVSSQFAWEDKGERWISIQAAQELMSPFQKQLAEGPVSHPYDLQILARMLVEIATADGNLGEEERAMLMEFLDPSLGSVDTLAQRPPLTEAELAQTSQGPSRGTMLMLAWVLTLADEVYDQSEQQKIGHFAHGLGISQAQHQQVLKAAQGFLLEQALDKMFTWGGHDAHARQELMNLASRLGLSPADAQQVEAAFQRRRGAA